MAVAPPRPDKVQIPQHDQAGRLTGLASFETPASISKVFGWEAFVRREILAGLKGVVTLSLFTQATDAIAATLDKRFEALDARLKQMESRLAETQQTKYVGVWKAAADYSSGNFVTRGGSVWYCRAPCRDIAPGSDPEYWQLMAKDRGPR